MDFEKYDEGRQRKKGTRREKNTRKTFEHYRFTKSSVVRFLTLMTPFHVVAFASPACFAAESRFSISFISSLPLD